MSVRAIKATFSDWRTVKSRKSLQLVFEVPLEQQGEVLTMLGAPMPDDPKWCAIALLNTEPAEHRVDITRSEQGKQRYAAASDMEKALIRAARLPKDERFRDWTGAETEENAARIIRENCCNGGSRRLIAEDEDCYKRFMRLETQYLADTGLMAVPR